jgi:Domain of unknown function (DUF309)
MPIRNLALSFGADRQILTVHGRARKHRTLPQRDGAAFMSSDILEGVNLFNAQKFFAAHEALEAVWLIESGERKLFLHGLIQVAAAFHHHSRNNLPGFKSLLERGWAKLQQSGAAAKEIDLHRFSCQLQVWREWIAAQAKGNGRAAPPIPRIEFLRKS